MSGIYEKEIKFELKILNRLKGEPQIVTDYYHSLIEYGKSYITAYSYICCVISFAKYTFGDKCEVNFCTRNPRGCAECWTAGELLGYILVDMTTKRQCVKFSKCVLNLILIVFLFDFY